MENIQRAIEARDVLPASYSEYKKKLEGLTSDVIYLYHKDVTERLDDMFFPEEINQEEAKKLISYLKTIGFFTPPQQ